MREFSFFRRESFDDGFGNFVLSVVHVFQHILPRFAHKSNRACRAVHPNRRTQAGFNRALEPRVRQRHVLTGEMDASLRLDDVVVQQRLLLGIEERERAAGEFVVVPHLAALCLLLASEYR